MSKNKKRGHAKSSNPNTKLNVEKLKCTIPNEQLYAMLEDMYGAATGRSTNYKREPVERLVERFSECGLTTEHVKDFIESEWFKTEYPREQQICAGVVSFYNKYGTDKACLVPIVPHNWPNVNEDERNSVLHKIQWVGDFVDLTHATTAMITAYTGLGKSSVDRIFRENGGIEYDLFIEHMPELYKRAVVRRNDNGSNPETNINRRWLDNKNCVAPEIVKAYLQQGRVKVLEHLPSLQEALGDLKAGIMYMWGQISLDENGELVGYLPSGQIPSYPDSRYPHYDKLKKYLINVSKEFNQKFDSLSIGARIGKCNNKPFRLTPNTEEEQYVKDADVYVMYVDFRDKDYYEKLVQSQVHQDVSQQVYEITSDFFVPNAAIVAGLNEEYKARWVEGVCAINEWLLATTLNAHQYWIAQGRDIADRCALINYSFGKLWPFLTGLVFTEVTLGLTVATGGFTREKQVLTLFCHSTDVIVDEQLARQVHPIYKIVYNEGTSTYSEIGHLVLSYGVIQDFRFFKSCGGYAQEELVDEGVAKTALQPYIGRRMSSYEVQI